MLKKLIVLNALLAFLVCLNISTTEASDASRSYSTTLNNVIMTTPHNITTHNTIYYTYSVDAHYNNNANPALVMEKHLVFYGMNGDASWWITGWLNKSIVRQYETILKDYGHTYNWVYPTGSYIWPVTNATYLRELSVNDTFLNSNLVDISSTNYAVAIFSFGWSPSEQPLQSKLSW